MIRAIFFDIDGTLMDFKAAERSAFCRAMAMRGIGHAEKRYPRYTVYNKGLWERMERGEITRDELLDTRYARFFEMEGITESSEGFEALYRANLCDEHQLMDGAIDILEYCFAKYPLYIVTNGIAATQRKRINDSKIEKYFKKIYISEEIGYSKPNKDYFSYCMSDAGLTDPSEILIIGDSVSSDMLGGINSGLKTCWMNPEGNKTDLKVDYEIQHLSELKEIL